MKPRLERAIRKTNNQLENRIGEHACQERCRNEGAVDDVILGGTAGSQTRLHCVNIVRRPVLNGDATCIWARQHSDAACIRAGLRLDCGATRGQVDPPHRGVRIRQNVSNPEDLGQDERQGEDGQNPDDGLQERGRVQIARVVAANEHLDGVEIRPYEPCRERRQVVQEIGRELPGCRRPD